MIAVIAVAAVSCSANTEDRVVVAAGTTLVDSGFLPSVVERFEASHPDIAVSVVGLSSAEAFAYGSTGTADVLITHDPAGLATFLDDHPDATTTVVFSSEFLLAAPSGWTFDDESVVDAFRSIATQRREFVSRDDRSGTNVRELTIWSEAGIDPLDEPWYTRTGSGMVSTLLIADERDAATLAERGAFLAASDALNLVEYPLERDDLLDNPYDVTVASESSGGDEFASWLVDRDGREAITVANEALFGSEVYRLP